MLTADARAETKKQWNTTPCGSLPTESFDAEYFARVEADRYRQQYWQHDFFQYEGFGDVLEIGVGLGTDLKQFARNGARCHGVDITQAHLEMTRLNFSLEGYDVDLREIDATTLPFPDNSLDCVYSFGVLHHIPDVDVVLREIHRVLKPGGVFQSAVYHRASLATALWLVRSAMDLSLFRSGYSGAISRIEKGADGVDIKPYVKLYSRSEWRGLAEQAGLRTRRTGIRQVHYNKALFLNALRPLERLIGWYVCGIFEKPVGASDPQPGIGDRAERGEGTL